MSWTANTTRCFLSGHIEKRKIMHAMTASLSRGPSIDILILKTKGHGRPWLSGHAISVVGLLISLSGGTSLFWMKKFLINRNPHIFSVGRYLHFTAGFQMIVIVF